jgi:hypothetical protein
MVVLESILSRASPLSTLTSAPKPTPSTASMHCCAVTLPHTFAEWVSNDTWGMKGKERKIAEEETREEEVKQRHKRKGVNRGCVDLVWYISRIPTI